MATKHGLQKWPKTKSSLSGIITDARFAAAREVIIAISVFAVSA